jgi:hypothetical protein
MSIFCVYRLRRPSPIMRPVPIMRTSPENPKIWNTLCTVVDLWTKKIEKQEREGKTTLMSLSPQYSPAPVPSLSPHLGSRSHSKPLSPLYLLLFPTSHSRMTSTEKTTDGSLLPPVRPRPLELAWGTPPSSARPRPPPATAVVRGAPVSSMARRWWQCKDSDHDHPAGTSVDLAVRRRQEEQWAVPKVQRWQGCGVQASQPWHPPSARWLRLKGAGPRSGPNRPRSGLSHFLFLKIDFLCSWYK